MPTNLVVWLFGLLLQVPPPRSAVVERQDFLRWEPVWGVALQQQQRWKQRAEETEKHMACSADPGGVMRRDLAYCRWCEYWWVCLDNAQIDSVVWGPREYWLRRLYDHAGHGRYHAGWHPPLWR